MSGSTRISRLAPWQAAALNAPTPHFAMMAGVGAGKTYTGSHFSIQHFEEHPDKTGFIGANTFDQLSTATLRELLYWLDEYKIPWVMNKIPPDSWGKRTQLPTYHNVLSVYSCGRVASAFTRVMSEPDSLRGIEISWYWLDETRDTAQYAHDMILGRCRESDYVRGLITTTTNGDSWDYQRFCGPHRERTLYSSMHIPTIRAVEYGILTHQYYNTLLKTYDPLMAEQELFAKHVNIFGGKAYYAANDRNRKRAAPWGDVTPSRERPLIVGCDFNFSPAPCVWIVGQIGPHMWDADGQTYFGECIHWFKEISDVSTSTPDMALKLLSEFPDFFYEVYGDMSGNVGTTSNAGQTDFDQIGNTLSDAEVMFSIAVEQMSQEESKQNPRVRSRVENMNGLFCNALGEVRQTYDPEGCPLFAGDLRMVGWKPTTLSGRGRLDDGGDKLRTHSTDGAGYAMWKKFPPGRKATLVDSVPSAVREHMQPGDNRRDW